MKVIFLGCTNNYGHGFSANVTKISLVARGLKEMGANCIIHNGIEGYPGLKAVEDVEYNGSRTITYKCYGHKLVSWIFNIRKLYTFLRTEKKQDDNNVLILELPFYHIFLVYVLLARILKYKIVDISHEWGPTVTSEKIIKKPSLWLFAKTFGWMVDGILPISEYIIKKISHFGKPYLKLPILSDFSDSINTSVITENKFVYCASVYYDRIIYKIIDAFHLYNKFGGSYNLILVLNGPLYLQNKVKAYIEKCSLTDRIQVQTNLPYKTLYNTFETASALLIPLDPKCEQDSARFSQKIAEYLSSKTPIITNNVGEICHYFSDNEVIKCDYTEEAFSQAFKWVEHNKETAKQIGLNGYNRGKLSFDYLSNAKKLYSFLQKI